MYTTVMDEITSLQNPRVKYVIRLREDKRQRKSDAQTIVEGKYELELALASGLKPREVYYCKEFSEEMSQRENPDGWIAIVPTPARELDSFVISKNPFFILAESVEKPGNLGAILRTADAAGVDGLIVSDPRVDLFNPHVVRASRGTVFSVPAVEIDNSHAMSWLKARKILVVASSPDAKSCYTKIDFKEPTCILVGTEDKGLSDYWLENADVLVNIPMTGKVNSLNVSTSTAILLYEVVRQRGLP
jgi:TrmH family RNA methyltransferase